MKIKLIILSAILLMFGNVKGQNDTLPQPIKKSKVPIWLNMGFGVNFANCYDNGTIPFSYPGVGINGIMGATVEWHRCHVQTETRLFFSGLLHVDGYAFTIDNHTEFLYCVCDKHRNRLHLWLGGYIQTYIDIKEISSLMNASLGVTTYENLCAEGMLQYDFAFIRGGSHNLFSTYFKMGLPLAGMAVRPSYAYMDNYTSDINMVNTLLNDYESFAKFFPGLSTDIGLTINLLNGNRIGLNYRWDYLSTGHRGTYRYDNAFHSINLNLMFNIN